MKNYYQTVLGEKQTVTSHKSWVTKIGQILILIFHQLMFLADTRSAEPKGWFTLCVKEC